MNYDERIGRLDTTLFDAVPTISSPGDRTSWLAIQAAVRRVKSDYCYLEIGSYVGGSLQQYYLDPCCAKIYSIDKYPDVNPDERGAIVYGAGLYDAMVGYLRQLDPERLGKLVYFEADSSEVDRAAIAPRADICFVDGEHTNAACRRDFDFCISACTPDAAIYFHDAAIVHRAITGILAALTKRRVAYTAKKLKGSTFAIFLGDCPAAADAGIRAISRNGRAFLWAVRVHEAARRLLPTAVANRLRRWGKGMFG